MSEGGGGYQHWLVYITKKNQCATQCTGYTHYTRLYTFATVLCSSLQATYVALWPWISLFMETLFYIKSMHWQRQLINGVCSNVVKAFASVYCGETLKAGLHYQSFCDQSLSANTVFDEHQSNCRRWKVFTLSDTWIEVYFDHRICDSVNWP